MLTAHVDELVQLWDGKPSFESHTVNYTLTGSRLDIQLHGRILPGHEETWDAGPDRDRGRDRAREMPAAR